MRVVAEQKQESTGLIPLEQVNAIELFTGNGLDGLLTAIETEAMAHVPSLKTPAERAAIASIAYKVSRSKTTIDDAGKELVSEWKAKAKAVDDGRKKARDFLDNLRDRVRQPLNEWEAEQARIEEEKRLAEEAEKARIEAERLAELEERERKVREAEEAQERARLEQERKDREAREAAERKEREERIRAEAEAKAKRDAEAALQAERDRAERAEQEAKEAKLQAERDRLADIEAERERAKREAEELENRRLADIERQRQADENRAADKKHRDKINAAAVLYLMGEGIKQTDAEKVVDLIAAGSVPAVSIRY